MAGEEMHLTGSGPIYKKMSLFMHLTYHHFVKIIQTNIHFSLFVLHILSTLAIEEEDISHF